MAKPSREKRQEYEKNRGKRYKSWLWIGYPDSLPEDYVTVINKEGLQWVEAMHDKDDKKPHIHFLGRYASPVGEELVSALTKKLNCPMPIPCKDVAGSLMYFTHNTEDARRAGKYEYPREILVSHGLDIDSFLELSRRERMLLVDEMLDFISQNNIVDYCDFVDYARANQRKWMDVIGSNPTGLVKDYIQSKWRKSQSQMEHRKRVELAGRFDKVEEVEVP